MLIHIDFSLIVQTFECRQLVWHFISPPLSSFHSLAPFWFGVYMMYTNYMCIMYIHRSFCKQTTISNVCFSSTFRRHRRHISFVNLIVFLWFYFRSLFFYHFPIEIDVFALWKKWNEKKHFDSVCLTIHFRFSYQSIDLPEICVRVLAQERLEFV